MGIMDRGREEEVKGWELWEGERNHGKGMGTVGNGWGWGSGRTWTHPHMGPRGFPHPLSPITPIPHLCAPIPEQEDPEDVPVLGQLLHLLLLRTQTHSSGRVGSSSSELSMSGTHGSPLRSCSPKWVEGDGSGLCLG